MGGLNGMSCSSNAFKSISVPALSLIEVIVASVIFLAVFMISLQMVVSLTGRQNNDAVYIVADMAIKKTYAEYVVGNINMPEYKKEYSWGNITGRLDLYGDYYGIEELTLIARLSPGSREIVYKYLIEHRYEQD